MSDFQLDFRYFWKNFCLKHYTNLLMNLKWDVSSLPTFLPGMGKMDFHPLFFGLLKIKCQLSLVAGIQVNCKKKKKDKFTWT